MAHVEPRRSPTKGKPWNLVLTQAFNHKVQLILPEDCSERLKQHLASLRDPPVFHRVVMPLGQVLDGMFFTEYIKRGNVLMLSEGKTTVNNVFSLREGLLTMYLDKETYERAGLVGKPHGAKGKRGLRPRWIVTYQLRDPSMLHGKKGFDRLLYACKNVLNQPVTWLFCNVNSTTPAPDPLQQYAPVKFTSTPSQRHGLDSLMPSLAVPSELISEQDRAGLEELATDVYEWLSLLRLESPRVDSSDTIDPYLSRYQVPAQEGEGTAGTSDVKLCKITWQGLLSGVWVRDLLVDLLTILPSTTWFSLSASSFSKGTVGDSDEVTFLRPPDSPNQYMLWEIRGEDP